MAKERQIVKYILEKASVLFKMVLSADRRKLQLLHYGDSWTKKYQNKPNVTILSDRNGVTVTLHGNKDIDGIRLAFHEAFDLGVALIEYAKSDLNAETPIYKVAQHVD